MGGGWVGFLECSHLGYDNTGITDKKFVLSLPNGHSVHFKLAGLISG